MTVYELLKTMSHDSWVRLADAGVINKAIEKHLSMYEFFIFLTEEGMPRMQAYTEVSERFFTSEDNVRKVVQKLCREMY